MIHILNYICMLLEMEFGFVIFALDALDYIGLPEQLINILAE